MGLFGTAVAKIDIDYYGQKRRNKAYSNVQVYFSVTISPHNLDPRYLGDLFSKAMLKFCDIAILPNERELFWTYVNESLQNIVVNPSSIFYLWSGFIDVAPVLRQPSGKATASINLQLMDKGKMKYKLSEGAPATYYNTIAPIALLQYIMSVLPPNQFPVFYDVFKQRMAEAKQSNKGKDIVAFDLEALPVLGGSPVV